MGKEEIAKGNFKHIKVSQFKVVAVKGMLILLTAPSLQGTHIKTRYCNTLQCTDTGELL